MSNTATDVANLALQELGAGGITNLTDSGKNARAMNLAVIPTRNKILRECSWNFASKQIALAEDPTDPLWDFGNRYRLPADFLYLEKIQCEPDYKLRGEFIHTNQSSPININYIAVIEDINLWDDSVIEAWAFKLAYKTCMSVTGDKALRDRLKVDYEQSIIQAKRFDGQHDAPIVIPDTDIFIARDNFTSSDRE